MAPVEHYKDQFKPGKFFSVSLPYIRSFEHCTLLGQCHNVKNQICNLLMVTEPGMFVATFIQVPVRIPLIKNTTP